jgi:hypothetical protein
LAYRHGAQGPFNGASEFALENEFGTHVDDEVIKQILQKGTLQETRVRAAPQQASADLAVERGGCGHCGKVLTFGALP